MADSYQYPGTDEGRNGSVAMRRSFIDDSSGWDKRRPHTKGVANSGSALADNDYALCVEDKVVDLSILVNPVDSGQQGYAKQRSQFDHWTRPEQKNLPLLEQLYPTSDMVHNAVPELSVAAMLEKTRIHNPQQQALRREPSILRSKPITTTSRRSPYDSISELSSTTPTRSVNARNDPRFEDLGESDIPYYSDGSMTYSAFDQGNLLGVTRSATILPGAYECSNAAAGPDYMRPLRQKEEILRSAYQDVVRRPEGHELSRRNDDDDYEDDQADVDSCDRVIELEIEPGVMSHLRGSKETWRAIQRGYTVDVVCFACMTALVCIADAEYVLCPDCRTVSPAAWGAEDRKCPAKYQYAERPDQYVGGVGLGLRADQIGGDGILI
jgi:hypothetical protein